MSDNKRDAIQVCIDEWQDINKRVRASVAELSKDINTQGRIKYMHGIIAQNNKYIAMAQSEISE